jgi:hypothetical protein
MEKSMAIVATLTDAVNSMMRRLSGQRLCEYCGQWAKKPNRSGDLYFCDTIHRSIYYNKQKELMKQALEKKRLAEVERQEAAAARARRGPPTGSDPEP